MRIVEIILGLGMITCAIFLGISTYKTHFRKKPADDADRMPSGSPASGNAASGTAEQTESSRHSEDNA